MALCFSHSFQSFHGWFKSRLPPSSSILTTSFSLPLSSAFHCLSPWSHTPAPFTLHDCWANFPQDDLLLPLSLLEHPVYPSMFIFHSSLALMSRHELYCHLTQVSNPSSLLCHLQNATYPLCVCFQDLPLRAAGNTAGALPARCHRATSALEF